MNLNTIIYLIPLLPLLGAILNGVRSFSSNHREEGRCEKLTALIAIAGPVIAFILSIYTFIQLQTLPHHQFETKAAFSWMMTSLFQVDFALLVDPLSSVMLLVVTGIGSLIHIYATGYMHKDRSYVRFFAYLNLFLFFMLILILGNNLLALFVGWEGVGLCSYLLIGFWFDDEAKAQCGKKAFIVNRVGDFAFLIGLFFVAYVFHNDSGIAGGAYFNFDFIRENAQLLAPLAFVIGMCFFIGATGKSAQIPLYVWLPDAMAGPTPVSALIHAATMVTAGIYMVARLFFVYELAPLALHIITIVGLATALMAALIAITQTDIKKVLAYSTVSQLGYMFVALGLGVPQVAIFHVITHAFFKACLFLGAGSVIHALHHEQDIRNMGGLLKQLPYTGFAFLISTLAISGFPPLSGFFSKDEILLYAFLNAGPIVYGIALFTAGLTAFYMMRLFVFVFCGEGPRKGSVHHLPYVMKFPVVILAILAAIGGMMGVPAALGGENHLFHWLEYLSAPVSHGDHHTTEYVLMGVSVVWAGLCSGLAYILYSKNLEWTQSIKNRFMGLYHIAKQKFYVDEIYATLFIRPIKLISETFFYKFADRKIIDGLLVHGGGNVALFTARVLRWFQTGFLSHYIKFLWLGLIVVLYLFLRVM